MVLAFVVLTGAGAPAAEVEGLMWPDSWLMFGPVDWEEADEVDARQFREIPDLMEFDGREHEGQTVTFEEDSLNIAELLSGHQRQDTVFLFGQLHADEAMEVMIGGAADWWMAWWVNGEPVYDTLETGNVGQDFTVTAHTFPVTLREGTNVVAIRVSAGRAGFTITAGIPPVELWDRLERVHGDAQRSHLLREFVSEAIERTEVGDLAGARSLFQDALELTVPDEHIWLSLHLRIAENYEHDGQPRRADEIYEELLAAELPQWAVPVLTMRLAQALQAAGDHREARGTFVLVARMRDAHPFTASGAILGIAEAFHSMDNTAMAARYYQRVTGMTDARPDHLEHARQGLEEITAM